MSQILNDSPEPGLEGEDLEYIKFVENMTPEKIKNLAHDLAQLYKRDQENVDT